MTEAECAEYVAIKHDYCVAHHAIEGDEEACEYADHYGTPCDFRPLYYLRQSE